MQPNTKRLLLEAVLLLGLFASITPLIMAKQIIFYPLIDDPALPVGNLIAAIAIICFVSLGHISIDALFLPKNKKQRMLHIVSKGCIFLSLLWLPMVYLLSGDFAANFEQSTAFRGSNQAGVMFRNMNIGFFIFVVLFWISAAIIGKLDRRNATGLQET